MILIPYRSIREFAHDLNGGGSRRGGVLSESEIWDAIGIGSPFVAHQLAAQERRNEAIQYAALARELARSEADSEPNSNHSGLVHWLGNKLIAAGVHLTGAPRQPEYR